MEVSLVYACFCQFLLWSAVHVIPFPPHASGLSGCFA